MVVPIGLVLLLSGAWLLIVLALIIGGSWWIYRDAERRGQNGAIWIVIWLLIGGLGLVIWLLVRPKRKR